MTVSIVSDLRRQFNALEADVMKAAAATLNNTAFEARRGIIDHSKRVLNMPKEWSTDRAWLFDKAKPGDGIRMFSQVKARPEQAKVLSYQIDGGVRKKGDVGAGRYDVPVGASDELTDRHGGIARGVIKKAAKKAAKEKKDRKALTARRLAARALRNGATTDKARIRLSKKLAPLKWVSKSKNEPGTFFGTVDGVKGYWQRPGRSEAAVMRRKGLRSVAPRGGNRPKLLVAFAEQAKYRRKPIKWTDVMARIQATKMTTANFGRELARIQASRSTP